MVDAGGLNPPDSRGSCGFESRPGYAFDVLISCTTRQYRAFLGEFKVGSHLDLVEMLEHEMRPWPVPHWGVSIINYAGNQLGDGLVIGESEYSFALASVSKPISALAALVAYEEGLFLLDDLVDPLQVSWRELLSHASGLAYDSHGAVAESDLESLFGSDGPARERYFSRSPRRRRIYSNLGFECMAYALAREAGIPFARYVQEAIFDPLGMRSSSMGGDVFATAGPSGAAAGVVSTVADMSKFMQELVSPRLVSDATLGEASRCQLGELAGLLPGYGGQVNNAWGLGFEIRDSKAPHWSGALNSTATFGHFGQSGTFIWNDPVAQIALCFLGNRPFDEFAKSAWPSLSDLVISHFEA